MIIDEKVKLTTVPPAERLVQYDWKVPFRQVYCSSFKQCVLATIWCHFVIKLFPHCVDMGAAPVEWFLAEPLQFFDQYEYLLRRVRDERASRR